MVPLATSQSYTPSLMARMASSKRSPPAPHWRSLAPALGAFRHRLSPRRSRSAAIIVELRDHERADPVSRRWLRLSRGGIPVLPGRRSAPRLRHRARDLHAPGADGRGLPQDRAVPGRAEPAHHGAVRLRAALAEAVQLRGLRGVQQGLRRGAGEMAPVPEREEPGRALERGARDRCARRAVLPCLLLHRAVGADRMLRRRRQRRMAGRRPLPRGHRRAPRLVGGRPEAQDATGCSTRWKPA